MADNLIVVNAEGPETRVGVVENGRLAEYLLERKSTRGIVGNIYKARVQKVLPGMQAAFVVLDKSIEKAAFLYGGDIVGSTDDMTSLFGEDVEADGESSEGEGEGKSGGQRRGKRKRQQPRPIQELIKEGQEIVVQVVKDAMGPKGARVTGYISLPGRYSVFMPMVDHVGVSRRIESDKERKRVRKAIEAVREKGAGFIVRTAAEGASDEEVQDDCDFLQKLWKEVGRRQEGIRAPGLVYADLDLVLRTIRDRLTHEIAAVVIDSESEYERARRFVSAFMPRWLDRIKLHDGKQAAFDHYGLEVQLRQALERRVNLKSGGSLVIDQGEALTAIDINTGSFVGKKDLEETLTRNNIEAAAEVANQLRLRNIGGIIVVDFVDMEQEGNRKKVFQAFMSALEADHSRTNVTKISELGLVEMTRKRTRESLVQLLTERCPACDGAGRVKSVQTVAYDILREIRRVGGTMASDTIAVRCSRAVANLLKQEQREYIDELEKKFQKKIEIAGTSDVKPAEFTVGGQHAPGAEPDKDQGQRRRGRRGGRGRKQKAPQGRPDGEAKTGTP